MSQDKAPNFSELTLESSILDSLAAHIAVLDPAGLIITVNLSWQTFAAENGMIDENSGVGANYLDVCRAANPDPNAREALQGIQGVMRGRVPSFYLKYPVIAQPRRVGSHYVRHPCANIPISWSLLTKTLPSRCWRESLRSLRVDLSRHSVGPGAVL